MKMPLDSEQRKMLAFFVPALSLGLIQKTEVIAWADAIIKKEEFPDDFICELSLYGSRDLNDLISYISEGISEETLPSAKELLAPIAEKFFTGQLQLGETIRVLFKIILLEEVNAKNDLSQEENRLFIG